MIRAAWRSQSLPLAQVYLRVLAAVRKISTEIIRVAEHTAIGHEAGARVRRGRGAGVTRIAIEARPYHEVQVFSMHVVVSPEITLETVVGKGKNIVMRVIITATVVIIHCLLRVISPQDEVICDSAVEGQH